MRTKIWWTLREAIVGQLSFSHLFVEQTFINVLPHSRYNVWECGDMEGMGVCACVCMPVNMNLCSSVWEEADPLTTSYITM